MVVISVSLSGKELKEFDSIVDKLGYSSRSDAVREAFGCFIEHNRWVTQDSDSPHLLVSLIYGDIKAHRILDIIHDFSETIHSSSHTHVDHKCVDQLVLKGENSELKRFVNAIAAVKDVRTKQVLL